MVPFLWQRVEQSLGLLHALSFSVRILNPHSNKLRFSKKATKFDINLQVVFEFVKQTSNQLGKREPSLPMLLQLFGQFGHLQPCTVNEL